MTVSSKKATTLDRVKLGVRTSGADAAAAGATADSEITGTDQPDAVVPQSAGFREMNPTRFDS